MSSPGPGEKVPLGDLEKYMKQVVESTRARLKEIQSEKTPDGKPVRHQELDELFKEARRFREDVCKLKLQLTKFMEKRSTN